MRTEQIDRTVAGMFEAASPQLSSGWRERTMTALRERGAAAPRSRRRFVVVAACAMVALVGIGFVPLQPGRGGGVWARAAAAVARATGWHVFGHGRYEGTLTGEFHDTWWDERAGHGIAMGATTNWDVTVHAIDVNRHGDLYVTVSRWLRPDGESQPEAGVFVPIWVEALDDTGVSYVQDENYVGGCGGCYQPECGYYIPILRREPADTPPGTASTITVTVYPSLSGPDAAQDVTFRDLPLPPPQTGEYLCREWFASAETAAAGP